MLAVGSDPFKGLEERKAAGKIAKVQEPPQPLELASVATVLGTGFPLVVREAATDDGDRAELRASVAGTMVVPVRAAQPLGCTRDLLPDVAVALGVLQIGFWIAPVTRTPKFVILRYDRSFLS